MNKGQLPTKRMVNAVFSPPGGDVLDFKRRWKVWTTFYMRWISFRWLWYLKWERCYEKTHTTMTSTHIHSFGMSHMQMIGCRYIRVASAFQLYFSWRFVENGETFGRQAWMGNIGIIGTGRIGTGWCGRMHGHVVWFLSVHGTPLMNVITKVKDEKKIERNLGMEPSKEENQQIAKQDGTRRGFESKL